MSGPFCRTLEFTQPHSGGNYGLAGKLKDIRSEFEGKTPPEKLAIMHYATDDLRRSGILERVLKAGDLAPEFLLPNWRGESIGSRELLARGPLVVTFCRGVW